MAFDKGVSILGPYHPPQKRHICHWDWGEGVEGFNLAQKGRAGDEINMRWMMMMTLIARGGSKGNYINDSISEHKCILGDCQNWYKI